MPNPPSEEKRFQGARNLDRLRLELLQREATRTIFLNPAVMKVKYPSSIPSYMKRVEPALDRRPETFSCIHRSAFNSTIYPPYSDFKDRIEVTQYVNFGELGTLGLFPFPERSEPEWEEPLWYEEIEDSDQGKYGGDYQRRAISPQTFPEDDDPFEEYAYEEDIQLTQEEEQLKSTFTKSSMTLTSSHH
jgi:hypothetical protein